jgi:Raf kinase inhibitor-like YbhB/YbcL family protein
MKRNEIIPIVSILLGIFSVITLTLLSTSIVYAKGFTLKSRDISGQLSRKQVLNAYGCHGENISPQLEWENAPEGTKSFAVTVHDPDAPTGSGWWHWVIFNIPADVKELEAGAGNEGGPAPEGSIQSLTDSGFSGFNGACPPKGDGAHRYIFTVYALDIEDLQDEYLDSTCPPGLVGYILNVHVIAKASLIAYYAR